MFTHVWLFVFFHPWWRRLLGDIGNPTSTAGMRAAQRLTAVLGPSRSGDDATCIDAHNDKFPQYKTNVTGVALLGVLKKSDNDWRFSSHFPCLRPLEPVSRVAVFLASMLTFEGCILINTINDQCNLSISVSSLHPSVPSQDTEALRKDNPQGD